MDFLQFTMRKNSHPNHNYKKQIASSLNKYYSHFTGNRTIKTTLLCSFKLCSHLQNFQNNYYLEHFLFIINTYDDATHIYFIMLIVLK